MDYETLARRIEERHPNWRVWRAQTGTWWAAATGKWTVAQENHGCMAHRHSDSAQELEKQIEKQDSCEACALLRVGKEPA